MPIVLSRKDLYERVWTDPIQRLSKEFGISDVGLAKACRRHNIPVPPRGYWARKAVGQNLRRPPLQAARNGIETVTLLGSPRPEPHDQPSSPTHPLIAFELQPENTITVPDDLRLKHPAIAQTRQYWIAQKRGEINYADNKRPRLNISVSKGTLSRALRILQALFSALEQRGHTVAATNDGKTLVTVLDEPLEVSLREPSKQVRHIPTAQELERAKKYSWATPAPYDLVTSGTLVLSIENVWGVRHSWKDGKKQRLENILNDVIIGLVEAALHRKAQEAERQRQRELAAEAERRREIARQKGREENARIRQFEGLRKAADEHRQLKDFVATLRGMVGAVDPDTEMSRWLTWADARVRRLDPLEPFRNPNRTVRLYHLTTRVLAEKILKLGFADRDPEYGEDKQLPPGVTLFSTPVTRHGYDEATVRIDVPEAGVLPYEWLTDTREFRRFAVPAAVVNRPGLRRSMGSDSN